MACCQESGTLCPFLTSSYLFRPDSTGQYHHFAFRYAEAFRDQACEAGVRPAGDRWGADAHAQTAVVDAGYLVSARPWLSSNPQHDASRFNLSAGHRFRIQRVALQDPEVATPPAF